MTQPISGLFRNEHEAENAINELYAMGYTDNDITVLMRDPRGNSPANPTEDDGSHMMGDIGKGAASGMGVGAILGGLLALGAVAIPGVGLVAAGALAVMAGGTAAGGAVGGLVGAYAGLGLNKEQEAAYGEGLRNGGVVVAVEPREENAARVQQLLLWQPYAETNAPESITPTNVYDHTRREMPDPHAYDKENSHAYHIAASSDKLQDSVNTMQEEHRQQSGTEDLLTEQVARQG